MKIQTVAQVLCLAVLAAVNSAYAAEAELLPAPDFVLKSLSGENIRLSEYRGRIVMLSFWASWCGDCRTQLEGLEDLYASYKDSGFELLAVSLDTERRQAANVAESLETRYPVLHDPDGQVGRLYEADSMPHVVFVDREGLVRGVVSGFRRDSDEQYLEFIRDLLRE
jgi:peroxiredoxin